MTRIVENVDKERVVHAQVLAAAALRVAPEAMAGLRKQPGITTPPTLLKHADEQTVVALAAVARARVSGLPMTPAWGVIAAPNFFGRAGVAHGIQRYRREGAWGISPHLIPHASLHAPSGTISQALGLHGPNFGVGGGPESSTEAFLTAATLLGDPRCPGLWLVLTGYTAEAIPNEDGIPNPPCEAVALALVPASTMGPGLSLRISPHDEGDDFLAVLTPFCLSRLVDELTRADPPPAALWRLGEAGWLELEAVR